MNKKVPGKASIRSKRKKATRLSSNKRKRKTASSAKKTRKPAKVKSRNLSPTDTSTQSFSKNKFDATNKLLRAITEAQSQFINNSNSKKMFDELLKETLILSESDFGFIGQVLFTKEGKPYLKTHTITNIAWNKETRKLYDQYSEVGMEFYNMDSLFGAVIVTGEPVISNDPSKDSRSAGIPQGHPPLKSFLGLPFYQGKKLIGMVGMANRPGGYDEEIIEYLQPFLLTCSNLIHAWRTDKKHNQMENSLRESESHLKSIIDNASSYIYIKDLSGSYILVNRQFEDLFGLSLKQIIGKTDRDLFDKEAADIIIENDRKILESKTPVVFEEKGVIKNKTRIYISNKFPLFESEGKPCGICGISTDITESKKIEEDLRESYAKLESRVQERTKELKEANEKLRKEIIERKKSEELLKGIINNSSAVIYLKDLNGRYILINKQYETLNKIKNEEIQGKTDFEIFPKKFAEAYVSNDRKVVDTKSVIKTEEFAQQDGLRAYISIKFPMMGQDGEVFGVGGISTDITERKKIEEALKESEEKFRQLAENVQGVFWVQSSDGSKTLYVNPQYEKIWGKSCESLYKNPNGWIESIIPEDQEKVIKAFKKLMTTASFDIEYRIIKPDGTIRWIWDRGFPIRNENEKIYRFAGIAEDITERKKHEEQLKSSLKEKEILLKEINHRTKNNMQVITSLLRIQAKGVQDESIQELYRESQNRIKSMSFIYSKIFDADDLVEIDTQNYFSSIVTEVFRSYGKHESGIDVGIQTNQIKLDIDTAINCGLILNELVSNALKHAFVEGGKGLIEILLTSDEKGMHEFIIRDNGKGISPDQDIHYAKSMGLQLVTTLAEHNLGGDIEVNNNSGAEFVVSFTLK